MSSKTLTNGLSSGSLRDILVPNKAPSAKKLGSRTTSQVSFQSEDLDADSIIRSILLEETGTVDKIRRKGSKRKKFAGGTNTSASAAVGTEAGSNFQSTQLARSSSNTVQSFAKIWGLPQDDISCIEKQFRQLHSVLQTSGAKLDSGYEDLQIDIDGDRRHIDSFVYSQAVLLASYSGVDIDTEDMVDICKNAVQPFDQQRTVPAGYTGEMDLSDEDGLDNFELDFHRWKTLILSHHRKRLIMGVLAEKKFGKLHRSSSSFLDTQGTPEFGSIANYEYSSMADMSVTASIMEAPSVATYNSNDLFDDFDMSLTQSTSKKINHNQSMYSKTSIGGKGTQSVMSTRSRSTTNKLPRIKSVPNLKFRSKSSSNIKKLKRSTSAQHNTIVEQPEDDMNPMERVIMLRRELENAKEGLAELDEKVDSNIAWVHSNCDTSVIGPISSVGKDKIRRIAIDRLFTVIDIRLKHSMYKALRKWENVIFTDKIRKTARDFSHIKGIEVLTRVLNGAICRRFMMGWQPWMKKMHIAKKWERNMAAVELQRVVRGMLTRLFLKDEFIRKAIIRIQALLRRRLGVKRVKKIRMLKNLAEKKAAKIRRDNEILRAKIEADKKQEALRRRRGPTRGDHRSLRARHTDAAIKIQKLHRGNMGRVRFFHHRRNHSALKIQKIVRGKLGRKRFKKIKGEQKGSWLGGILSSSSKPKVKKEGGGGMFSKLGFGGKKSQENSDTESVGSTDPSVNNTKPNSPKVATDQKKIDGESIKEETSKPTTPAQKSSDSSKSSEGQAKLVKKTQDQSGGSSDAKKAAADEKKKPGSASSTASKPGSASSTASKPGSASSTASKPGKDKKDANSSGSSTPKSAVASSKPVSAGKKDDSPAASAPPKKLSKLQQMKADEEAKKKEKELNAAKDAAAEVEREAQKIKDEAIAEKAKIKEQAEKDAADMKIQAEEELAEARAELEEELEKEKEEWMKQLEELKKQNEELQAAKAAADSAKAVLEAKVEADLAKAIAEAEQNASEAAARAREEAEAKLKSESMSVTREAQNEANAANAATPEASTEQQRSRPSSREAAPSSPVAAPISASSAEVDSSVEQKPQQDQAQSSFGSIALPKMDLGGFWKKPTTSEERARPATSAGEVLKEMTEEKARPSSAFNPMSFFGGGKDKKGKNKKKKQKFVPPAIDKFEANRRISRAATIKAAFNEVKRRREAAQVAQALVGKRILWATVIIQARIARGPIGRKRFVQRQDDLIKAREVRRNKSATKIQAMVRAVPDRIRVRQIRAEKEREEKMASMLKFKKDQEDANAFKVQGSGLTPEQEAALQSKLDRLAEMEKSIIEKELKMAQATRLAEERATAMEKAMKDFEERARIEEAERAMQRQMMELAAGPVQTARSEVPIDPKTTRTPRTKRDNHDPPPTARSAREEGIPKDAEKISFEGRKWYQLWDEQESAYYWYCPATKAAQWEKPGDPPGTDEGYESGGNTTDYSTDWYESGGDYTDGEGETWQEFFDDSAQAKYWYNPATGEASWVQPTSSGRNSSSGRRNSQLIAKKIPGDAYNAPDDWISYMDAETQQEYWYNTKTGETSWDR